MGTPRTYTVRGFNPTVNPFDCRGVAKDTVPGFLEIEDVPTEAKAVELLLTHPDISQMVTGVPRVSTSAHVDVLNIKLAINVGTTAEAKAIRKELVEAITSWAEKSRVRGVRGWRAHAIKTPKMQKLQSASGYEFDFDAIFGHAVFYNERQFQVGKVEDAVFTKETMTDLRRHLDRSHPGLVSWITFKNEAADIVGAA